MSVTQVQTITAILAIAAAALTVAVIAARMLSSKSRRAARVHSGIVRHRNHLSAAVAGVATAGSLYFSEVAHFLPCRLCWFQRIAMYPLAVIAAVAVIRRDTAARFYMTPIAAIGAAISTYHYLIENGVIADSEACGITGPACSIVWFREFGFISLAFMALCGFAAIAALNLFTGPADHPLEETS